MFLSSIASRDLHEADDGDHHYTQAKEPQLDATGEIDNWKTFHLPVALHEHGSWPIPDPCAPRKANEEHLGLRCQYVTMHDHGLARHRLPLKEVVESSHRFQASTSSRVWGRIAERLSMGWSPSPSWRTCVAWKPVCRTVCKVSRFQWQLPRQRVESGTSASWTHTATFPYARTCSRSNSV